MIAPAKQTTLETEFAGSLHRLGRMALVTGALTLLTFGLYAFWARARLRRWYWSAIRPGGLPFEYTGNGFETFTAFLWAVAFAVLWFGVVSTGLYLAGVSLLGDPVVGPAATFVLLVPVWLWLRFRIRAYRISRTRWRGIAFRVENKAVGYVVRVFWHFILAVISLGLLWPRMTFRLEAFRTERTYFGDHQILQGGRWQMLVKGFIPLYLTLLAMIGAGYVAAIYDPRAIVVIAVLCPVLGVGVLYYRVRSLRLLTSHKTIGEVRLTSMVLPRRVLRILLFNGLALGVILALPFVIVAIAVLVLEPDTALPDPTALPAVGPVVWAIAGVGAVLLIGALLVVHVLRHVLIVMPIRRQMAQSLSLQKPAYFARIGRFEAVPVPEEQDRGPGKSGDSA